MSPEMLPGGPADWLRFARSDLALAKVERPEEVLLETLCFHAQQAVEKALKAVLVSRGIGFTKIHNIKTLIEKLPHDIPVPPYVQESAQLTDHAITSRYPTGMDDLLDEQDYQESIKLAEATVRWATGIVTGK